MTIPARLRRMSGESLDRGWRPVRRKDHAPTQTTHCSAPRDLGLCAGRWGAVRSPAKLETMPGPAKRKKTEAAGLAAAINSAPKLSAPKEAAGQVEAWLAEIA